MEKEFEESFEKIYSNIYEKCFDKLNEHKNKKNKVIFIILVIEVFINLIILFLRKQYIFLTLTISITLVLIVLLVIKKSYARIYKLYVINELVKSYNKNLSYEPNMGIPTSEYVDSKFEKNFDEYFSEDRISGSLENLGIVQMAEVVTQDVSKTVEEDGSVRENKTVLFRGIFGSVQLNNNNNNINVYVASNSNFRKFDKTRVEVDSAEFEKYYDLITNDKITAMRIYTPDLVEKYIDIIKNKNNGFELKIIDNKIYFRYKCSNAFEPPTFKTGIEKDFVKDYYRLIYYPLEIIKATIKNINEL